MYPVHFGEHGIDRILDEGITTFAITPRSNRIDLINKQNARRLATRPGEQLGHLGPGFTDIAALEIVGAGDYETHPTLVGQSAGDFRLAGAGRAIQQDIRHLELIGLVAFSFPNDLLGGTQTGLDLGR